MSEDGHLDGAVPWLEVLEGRCKGDAFLLEPQRDYLIGRWRGAEIRVDDRGVSRRHATLTCRSDGAVEVIDLQSTNGSFVNGQRTERATLHGGDLLELGPGAVLLLNYRGADASASRCAGPTVAAPATAAASETTVVGRAPLSPAPDDLPITARQLEISRLVARGLTNAAVAENLNLSLRTVTTHLDHIYRRLGINSRVALTRFIV